MVVDCKLPNQTATRRICSTDSSENQMELKMVLNTFVNPASGLESHVVMMRLNGKIHYGVDVFDLDAQEFLPTVEFHDTRELAEASAKTAIIPADVLSDEELEELERDVSWCDMDRAHAYLENAQAKIK